MRFSLLALVVALTASMSVSACATVGQLCETSNCCNNLTVPLREEIWSARRDPSLLKINPAARAARRDSESCFCSRLFIMVDGVIPSSEPISTAQYSTVVFGKISHCSRNIDICEYYLNGRLRA
ncbi:uncharacterized protein HD556DRAFT_1356996 [Suillus plorans]|uniref:Hydrophobin n=1 Tax=Suillus plorans TaxID=116603 RepID=A0A9P7DL34_9AGAM|nr:uncharacterized protein HD556DRAFT_1356996 [Suillus plorans]KAG1797484.1 hypothetical protein HD556DRAFT_1356996 [Suillus plorans]